MQAESASANQSQHQAADTTAASVDSVETSAVASTPLNPEDLFRLYADDVFRYVRRRVDANDAEDITAEVFVTACRKVTDIPAEAELPWLYRTAWNLVSNHWRKQIPVVVEQVQETANEFDDFADLVTESAALRAAWAGLSVRDREVLRLVAWEGLDGAGLAAALGIGVSGAGAAVWRARQHLQAAYQAASADPASHVQEPPAPRHRDSEPITETGGVPTHTSEQSDKGSAR